jgi:hypothetical protein
MMPSAPLASPAGGDVEPAGGVEAGVRAGDQAAEDVGVRRRRHEQDEREREEMPHPHGTESGAPNL